MRIPQSYLLTLVAAWLVASSAAQNLTALPRIPSDFKLRRREKEGELVGFSVASSLHLLLGLLNQPWENPVPIRLPAVIRHDDPVSGLCLGIKIEEPYVREYSNSKIAGWIMGRVIEDLAKVQGREERYWVSPSKGYAVETPVGRPVGEVLVGVKPPPDQQHSNVTDSLFSDSWPPNGTKSPSNDDSYIVNVLERPGDAISPRAVTLLLVEYLYKVLYALNYDRLIRLLERQSKTYESDPIYGVMLRITYDRVDIGLKRVRAIDVAYCIVGLFEKLDGIGIWKPFQARCNYIWDTRFFLTIEMVQVAQSTLPTNQTDAPTIFI